MGRRVAYSGDPVPRPEERLLVPGAVAGPLGRQSRSAYKEAFEHLISKVAIP